MNASSFRQALQKPIDHFHEQTRCIRSGGITPQLVDTVKVVYHGQPTPIKHLARTTKVASGISVEPYDANLVKATCKALTEAGFQAYVFSKTAVAVSVPPPSGEDRDKVHKRIRELAEEARVAVRQTRKSLKKQVEQSGLPDDQQAKLLKQLQQVTDEAVQLIDKMAAEKVKSL